jgi:Cof subfamily protein (haloacid dehalogenase superfamily)
LFFLGGLIFYKFTGKMAKPVICFDLDGTLLDENEIIHPNDIELLSIIRNTNYLVSTGRALPSIKGVFSLNGLFRGEKIPIPIVSQNGAVLYGPEEQLHEFHSFNIETQNLLLNCVRKFPQVPFFLFAENEIYLINPNQLAQHYASMWFYPLKNLKNAGLPNVSKVMALSYKRDLLQDFVNMIQPLEIEASFSLNFLLEITPAGVNKGKGLERLLSYLNWELGAVFYAGDGGNDLPVFKISARSFVPITASKHIKTQADYIIDTKKTGLLSPILQNAGIN